jgi:hypothetical protein
MKTKNKINLKAFTRPTSMGKEVQFMQKSGALTIILVVIDLLAFVLINRYKWTISPFLIFLIPILLVPLVTGAIPDAIRFHSYAFSTPYGHSCIDSTTPYRRVKIIANDKDMHAKVIQLAIFVPGYSSVKWLPFSGGGRHGYWIVPDDDDEGRGYIQIGKGIHIINDAELVTFEQLPPEVQDALSAHETFNIYTSPIYWAMKPPDIKKRDEILKAYSEEYGKKQIGSLVFLIKTTMEDLTHADTSRKRIRQRSYESIKKEGSLRSRYIPRNKEEEEATYRGSGDNEL